MSAPREGTRPRAPICPFLKAWNRVKLGYFRLELTLTEKRVRGAAFLAGSIHTNLSLGEHQVRPYGRNIHLIANWY